MTPLALKENPGGEPGKQALRVWLQLLSLTTRIEKKIRRRLWEEFETTLPRFDVLATLERAHRKMTMGELSRRLLVSKGNVTGIVASLTEQGLVKKENCSSDRRTHFLSLTRVGEAEFNKMAAAHQGWIEEIFSGLDEQTRDALLEHLTRLKTSIIKNNKGAIS